eukprot:9582-Heterococcus_DN1.PRE.7
MAVGAVVVAAAAVAVVAVMLQLPQLNVTVLLCADHAAAAVLASSSHPACSATCIGEQRLAYITATTLPVTALRAHVTALKLVLARLAAAAVVVEVLELLYSCLPLVCFVASTDCCYCRTDSQSSQALQIAVRRRWAKAT